MGWVSYIEDIQKLRDDIDHFRRRPATRPQEAQPAWQPANRAAQLAAYERSIDSIAERLEKLLSVATDPTISLAAEHQRLSKALAEAEQRHLALQDQIAALQQRCSAGEIIEQCKNAAVTDILHAKITRLETSLATKQQELRRERRRADEAEAAFERISRANFAAAVAAFPPIDKDRDLAVQIPH